MSFKVRHKLYEVRQELMETIFGKWSRQRTQRLSHLCHLEPDKYRRVLLMQKLRNILEDLGEEVGAGDIETRTLKSWMKEQGVENVLTRSEIFDKWDKIETQRKRRIPTDNRRLNSSLTLKQSRHRNLCSKWFFGRFHSNPSLLEEDLGLLGKWCYSVLSEVLAKSQWTEVEYRNAVRAINIILNHAE